MLACLQNLAGLGIILTTVAASPGAVPVPLDGTGLQRAGLTRYWEANLSLAKPNTVKDAVLVDEALYVTTTNGTVYSVKADVGLIRWGAKVSGEHRPIFKPTHVYTSEGAGPTVIPTTDSIYIVDRFTGDVIRTVDPPFIPGSTSIGVGTHLFLGSLLGSMYALEWAYSTDDDPVKVWEVRTGGALTAAPVLYHGDRLIFASHSGTVFSCMALDKSYLWSFRTGGAIVADPVEADGGLYVASMDRSLYRLDADSGEPTWRIRLEDPLDTPPVVTSDTVFQHCPSHGLVAIDPASGKEKWRVAGGLTLAAHIPKRDVVFTGRKYLNVVDHESGELLAAVYTSPTARAVPNARNDAVYLYEPDGRITCLRSRGVPYQRPREINVARARLIVPPVAENSADQHDMHEGHKKAGSADKDPFRSRRDMP